MAKTVILVDDIDGSSNAETVRFSYDGVAYSIDLSRKNRAAFDKAIKPWVQAATRQSRGSRTRRRQAPRRPARTRSQHSGPD